MLGTQQVDKIMLGTTEVWSNKISRLYTKLSGVGLCELEPETGAVINTASDLSAAPSSVYIMTGTNGKLIAASWSYNAVFDFDLDTFAATQLSNPFVIDNYPDDALAGSKDSLYYTHQSHWYKMSEDFVVLEDGSAGRMLPIRSDTQMNNVIQGYSSQKIASIDLGTNAVSEYTTDIIRPGGIAFFKDMVFVMSWRSNTSSGNPCTHYDTANAVGDTLASLSSITLAGKIEDLAAVK